jgi:long-chain acyl-CoA synthetase
MINIDVQAVGDWAERRGIPYSGYTDLAAKPQVVELIRECVEKVNADLAAIPKLSGSQIHRFVILHKELDADDGELTRTRKVRRGFIGEKYATIVDALYSAPSTAWSRRRCASRTGARARCARTCACIRAKTFAPAAARRAA